MNRLIHQDVAHRVFKVGEPISLRKQVTPVPGVQHDYVNAAIHGAATGEHVLSISSLDKDGNYLAAVTP